MTDKFPREQLVVEEILKENGVTKYQPSVVNYLMDYTYTYLQTVLEDAKIYSEHANKRNVDIEDLQLAVNLTLDKTHNTLPSKEFLLKLAKDKNSQPLPPIPEGRCGVRLPPDRLCLTGANIAVRPSQKPQQLQDLMQSYRGYAGSYTVKTEPVDNIGFQPQHYSGQVYGKRKREQMDMDDYDM